MAPTSVSMTVMFFLLKRAYADESVYWVCRKEYKKNHFYFLMHSVEAEKQKSICRLLRECQ
jgi:hypothetical protein